MEAQQVLGGRYRLEEQLGRGGMAVVWRARDEVLGRSVAVKLLAGQHAADPVSRRRIRDEARAAAALSHPNIAQVYDFGESVHDGTCIPYVVMELIPGCTLEQRLLAGPLPPKVAFRVCAEVAAALAAAHADGLVHRDIKAANVMVTPAGAKVVDFGIAAAISRGGAAEPAAELLGTPAYLAPERLTGDAVEPASDVYAAGVLLYKLLAGHGPWSADSATQMLIAHVYVEPEPLPSLPDVPDEVTDLCQRCLRKDPAQRPTADEVAAVLARAAGVRVVGDELAHALAPAAVDGEPSTVLVPGPVAGTRGSRPGPRRQRVRLVAVAVAVAAITTAGLLWILTPTQPEPRDGARPAQGSATDPPRGGAGTPGPVAAGASGVRSTPGQTAAPGAGPPGAPARDRPPDAPNAAAGGSVPTVSGGAPDPPPATAPASPTTPPPAPAPQERTLTSVAGTVRATCTTAGDAELLSWKPTRPYRVEHVEPGPATAAVASFVRGNSTVRMTVTCSDGVPSATTG